VGIPPITTTSPAVDAPRGVLRAGLRTSALWSPGERLVVRFLDGSDAQRRFVVQTVANKFAPHVGLCFEFLGEGSGDRESNIRITFDAAPTEAWSYMGTDALSVPQTEPTMALGWLDEDDGGAVVLHEFGHSVGMIHEHQHPGANISWNRSKIERDLREHGWDAATIEFNMFSAESAVDHSAYDPFSIMHYGFDASWIEGDHHATHGDKSTALSFLDKAWLAYMYPS